MVGEGKRLKGVEVGVMAGDGILRMEEEEEVGVLAPESLSNTIELRIETEKMATVIKQKALSPPLKSISEPLRRKAV